jgi:hypothetical protein
MAWTLKHWWLTWQLNCAESRCASDEQEYRNRYVDHWMKRVRGL